MPHSDFQLICGTNRDLYADAGTQPLNASTSQLARPAFRRDLLARINLWSFRLPGLADRREDIEPNLDYELIRFSEKTGKHISFNKEARQRFLSFALDPNNPWSGNFRDLNAMVVRMATLADGGRITLADVNEEISRCAIQETPSTNNQAPGTKHQAPLSALLGKDYADRYDDFDLVQLAHVIEVCRASVSAADAARKLYAVSFKTKTSSNSTDRLSKYLARFGLKFREISFSRPRP